MSLPKVKIELVNYGILDQTGEFPMPITLDINDVRDISNRAGTWSKTVKIPGTNNNNSILGSVFEVNLQNLTFNPNIKETVIISADGLNTFEATFQLKKVNRKYSNDEDFTIVYDCYLQNETSSFYSIISGKYLTDLDVSAVDHVWDIGLINGNMAEGSWLDGYQYFLPYITNDTATYEARDLIPAIYAKTYWDTIFREAGFTYEFDELFDIKFDKLIIPYNSDEFDGDVPDQFNFLAGITTGYDYQIATSGPQPTIPISNFTSFNQEDVIFNDDTPPPWFDTAGRYDTITGRYDVTGISGVIEFFTNYDVSLQLLMIPEDPAFASNAIFASTGRCDVRIRNRVEVYDSNDVLLEVLSEAFTESIAFNSLNMTTAYSTNFRVEAANLTIRQLAVYDSDNYINADASYVKNRVEIIPLVTIWYGFESTLSDRYSTEWYLEFVPQISSQASFKNSTDTYITPGDPVEAKFLVPKKIKQSDFILSLVKMHNLYFIADKIDPNKIIIKTRDKFYEDGAELNWTKKVHTKSIDVGLISNTQNKIKIFTYKQDTKDELAKDYTDTTNETYGDLEYVFENEFISNVTKFGPIFSPTFITSTALEGSSNVVPFIDGRNPKNNIRILYVGSLIEDGNWFFDDGVSTTTGYSRYRYAGHLYPNIVNPMIDLNFGISEYYSHTGPITDNNLFNRFYFDQMNIFETGHILTAHFNLNFADITSLKLDERIYVYNSWWHINKIFDYNVTGNNLTKVELITADTLGQTFTANNDVIINQSNPMAFGRAGNIQSVNDMSRNTFGNGTANVKALGVGNTVQSGSTSGLIAGDNNRVSGHGNVVSGDNNVILGNNKVALGINDAEFTEGSSRVYANTLIRFTNFISAGRDEVLNEFPDNKVVNVIDAGRDVVRPLGGYSIETVIDAGRDAVLYTKK